MAEQADKKNPRRTRAGQRKRPPYGDNRPGVTAKLVLAAQAALAEMKPPGVVADGLTTWAKKSGETVDEVMRQALSGLLDRHGYSVAQLRATAQHTLQEVSGSKDATEQQRLAASRKLRRYFLRGQTEEAGPPEILRTLKTESTERLREERERLRRELKLARRKELPAHKAAIRVEFSRAKYRKRRQCESFETRSRTPKWLAEIKIFLAYPYLPEEIIEIMKKRHQLSKTVATRLLQEALSSMAQDAQLHPVQIELLAQQRAIAIIKDDKRPGLEPHERPTVEAKLRAVDSLIETTHLRTQAGTGQDDDVSAMHLRARVQDMNELLPKEIDTLIADLMRDAEERWHWRFQ